MPKSGYSLEVNGREMILPVSMVKPKADFGVEMKPRRKRRAKPVQKDELAGLDLDHLDLPPLPSFPSLPALTTPLFGEQDSNLMGIIAGGMIGVAAALIFGKK